MSPEQVHADSDGPKLRRFTRRVLEDLRALERILDEGLIETDIRRIGAEQELVLVDEHGRPASRNMDILEQVDDPRLTTEIGAYNLEGNLEPIPFEGGCLRRMEDQLRELLGTVQEAASDHGASVLLTGILPTLRKSDLTLDNMSPRERYRVLNDALTRLRGRPYEFYIKGADELLVKHDNVMVESCNTSFQVHFQVAPDEFVKLYNIAMAVTGPVLAAAVNSPLLFGRRLWKETRIALFRQALETRSASPHLRESRPRVHFGRQWVEDSVLEIFWHDIARFPVLITADVEEAPFDLLQEERAPELKALQLFNSTVYRWNRPCYGVLDGRAHLRIENRVLPSGPTVVDEIANAAFWLGLMSGFSREVEDIREVLDFDDVRRNFLAAAHLGIDAQFTWTDKESWSARDLISERLLPLAREGLEAAAIAAEDVDRYLGVLAERVEARQTGADWFLNSLTGMEQRGSGEERLTAVTLGALSRQETGRPVHEWELAGVEEAGGWPESYRRVEQVMNTDLLTVNEEEPVELVAGMMEWHGVHYVPVEDREERLVGLVSQSGLNRFLAQHRPQDRDDPAPVPVYEVMYEDIVTVSPETETLEAIELMREHEVGCLPVVSENRLVGLVTEEELMSVAAFLFEERLSREQETDAEED